MKKPTAKELIEALGYNDVAPIYLTPGMQKEIENECDDFREWMEEEVLK